MQQLPRAVNSHSDSSLSPLREGVVGCDPNGECRVRKRTWASRLATPVAGVVVALAVLACATALIGRWGPVAGKVNYYHSGVSDYPWIDLWTRRTLNALFLEGNTLEEEVQWSGEAEPFTNDPEIPMLWGRLDITRAAFVATVRLFPALLLSLIVYHWFVFPWFVRGPLPRCRACGYALHGLTEPRCPECGTRI